LTAPDEDSLHYVASPPGRDRSLPPRLEERLEAEPDNEELQAQRRTLLNRPDELTIARIGGNSANEVINHEYATSWSGDADLVAGTMSSLSDLDADSQFDLVVVDEAGQAAQPSSFIPLLRGDRIVLAGDHLQLPPYAADEFAKEEEMHISLFEHLLETYGPSISVMLRCQYRMNESIAEFPNEHIYDGQLESGDVNRSWTIDDLQPIMGVNVEGDEQTREATHSKLNPSEAAVVANHVKLLRMHDVPLADIGIITPYTAQIGAIQSAVYDEIGTTRNLKIATVDSFQGSERDAIIVSFVRSNAGNHTGFLSAPEEGKRRLNVSLTRAKKRLVLIGDWNTLGSRAEYEDSADSCSNLYGALYKQLDRDGVMKQL
jgi:superfamily I DNA and/or RNA helicase